MYQEKLPYRQFPKVPLERRIYAFLIDFVIIWIISSLVTDIFLEFLTFCLLWFILRIVVVDRNRGQSLGRWALDIKIKDARFNKIPPIVSLFKREGIICLASFLAMIGLNEAFTHPISTLLLISPLLIDGGLVITDEELNQAFHDRIAQTIVIQTQRGFSLDLRLKKLFKEVKRNYRKRIK
jgi:uncharacterized RDD family membrane protein YckC